MWNVAIVRVLVVDRTALMKGCANFPSECPSFFRGRDDVVWGYFSTRQDRFWIFLRHDLSYSLSLLNMIWDHLLRVFLLCSTLQLEVWIFPSHLDISEKAQLAHLYVQFWSEASEMLEHSILFLHPNIFHFWERLVPFVVSYKLEYDRDCHQTELLISNKV